MEFKVLIVDDETAITKMMVSTLRFLGLEQESEIANSGREALELLKGEKKFDLLITDVVMPDISGVEVAKKARTTYPDIKIVFMTGYSNGLGREMETISRAILFKPFNPNKLKNALLETGIEFPKES